MYLISVTPDPTGPAGNKSAGFFTVDGTAVTHVDAASSSALQARFGAPVVVSPVFYAGLLANRTAVTVQLDAGAVAAALKAAVPSADEIAAAVPAHLDIAVTSK